MKIIFLIIFTLILYILLIEKPKHINIYKLEQLVRPLYGEVKLDNLFQQVPENLNDLNFGYICPGAMKTVKYLNNQNISNDIRNKIISLTDLQFFIEIYAIYDKYLDKKIFNKISRIIGNNSCRISNLITQEITRLFGKLPKNIRTNLPDDFYHIRHDTLICSNNETLVDKRIQLLKSIYENFDSHKCIGKRDGVSGCRDCCSQKYPANYRNCVNLCMN